MAGPEEMDSMLSGPGYVAVPVGTDAEQMAETFIADTLPQTFLNEIDLATRDGMEQFLPLILIRRNQAVIEKDELIAFVRRNERILRRTRLAEALASNAEQIKDEATRRYIVDLAEQIRHVLEGRIDQVDLVSSRLLWLCVALDANVRAGSISHDQAVKTLRKDQHRQRITPKAVLYMCNDYLENRDLLGDPRTEYVMLLVECALLCDDDVSLVFAFILLSDTPPPADIASWLDLVERAAGRLQVMDKLGEHGEQFLQRVRTRYRDDIGDDDF